MNNYYNRAVYFNKDICVAIGCSGEVTVHDYMCVIPLPSDHYDFAGYLEKKLIGKTKEEVRALLVEDRGGEKYYVDDYESDDDYNYVWHVFDSWQNPPKAISVWNTQQEANEEAERLNKAEWQI